jgi:hypothetical protein
MSRNLKQHTAGPRRAKPPAALLALPETELLLLLLDLDSASLRTIHRRWGIRDGSDSPLPLAAHQVLLWRLWPQTYAEPPAAAMPSKAMIREAKEIDLAKRRAAHVSLWHPGDYLSRAVDYMGALGGERTVYHCGNGEDVPGKMERSTAKQIAGRLANDELVVPGRAQRSVA